MRLAPFVAALVVCTTLSALAQAQAPNTQVLPTQQAPQSSLPVPVNPPEAAPPPAPSKPMEASPLPPPPAAPMKPAEAAPAPPPARFSFSPVETGVLRLDTETGQVALCRAHAVGWACEAVPEDRAALETEITRLQDEVRDLKRQLSDLQRPLTPPRPPAPIPDTTDKRLPVPSAEDIEHARAYLEDAWRRLVEMLLNFQKDVMRKT